MEAVCLLSYIFCLDLYGLPTATGEYFHSLSLFFDQKGTEWEPFIGAGKPDDVAASLPATSPPPPARLEPSLSRADRAVVRGMTLRLLLRKLTRNPNIWACLGGAAYSLASFGWEGNMCLYEKDVPI